jgi:DNA mismatch repair protein MSH6
MELQEAEAAIESSTSQTLMECMASFGQFRDMVDLAIANSAELDVLCSLAQFCLQTSSEMTMCRPELVRREPNGGPIFEVQGMKHPYVRPGGETFIPNDLALGDATPAIMLITGPNMGGKSTILRQVCITAIMAQLGCYVAAESCRMSPVDRIFTRLGARDHIMAGKSTFFVELEETSKILHEASPDSLVILDELGRGTSTFDGYSIAYAVLKHLQNTQSRVLFSTHYHKLCDEFNQSAGMIQQAYMDCRMYQFVHLSPTTCSARDTDLSFAVSASLSCTNSFLEQALQVSVWMLQGWLSYPRRFSNERMTCRSNLLL